MRMLLKLTIPNGAGNRLAAAGKLGSTIKTLLEEIKPEAAYFIAEHGRRTGVLVVNLERAADIPAIAEPLFLALEAEVEMHPCMLPEDLAQAGPAIESAARRYGQPR